MSLFKKDEVGNALRYLAENAEAAAEAKAARTLAEHKRDIIKAMLIYKSNERNAQLREAWAKAHDEYLAACTVEADAVKEDELHKAKRVHALSVIQAWQTESANIRGAEKVL